MKKKKIAIVALALTATALTLFVNPNSRYKAPKSTPTQSTVHAYYSKEADESFISSLAPGTDLNSGITIERSTPLYASQSNNITFAVFNHTDEPIMFSNQGFGLIIFGYNDSNETWKRLELKHVPYPENTLLAPKIERWNSEKNNTWDVLENDTRALGYKTIRLYVSGNGTITNTTYGAYLDANITSSP